ncbi:MAG: GNAT family N-acetyltransferase [Spirochaetaceae bacterium]|nr:MAG: GNAT family N-acetyltransferase [Spirochaetaceae bacterium]
MAAGTGIGVAVMSDGGVAGAGFVREMMPGEKRIVSQVMRRSFNWFTRLFFDFGSKAYVYELEGQIVAGITLKTFRIRGERPGTAAGSPLRGGLVKWVFTTPEARGRGAAGQLVDTALEWFRQEGCSHVFACIEGHNTGSSGVFARRDFSLLSFREQVRCFGRALPRVWVGTFHLFDVGHFLWARRAHAVAPGAAAGAAGAVGAVGAAGAKAARDPAEATSGALAATIVLQSLAFYLAAIRWNGTGGSDPISLAWQVLVVVSLLFGARLGTMAAVARATGRRVLYRPWETGLFLSLLLGAVGWGPFPAPGSWYPAAPDDAPRDTWSYGEELPWLGPTAYAGGISVLILGWLMHVASAAYLQLPALVSGAIALGVGYARILLIFEVLIPTFPFTCYNGRRVLDWRRPSWAVLALGTLLLWVASW